jgi:hypothetical protein
MMWIESAGALVTFALGVLGLVRPRAAAKLVGIEPIGTLGVSEVRATYGGLFTALGLCALVSQSQLVFTVVGLGWAGIAAGRLVSVLVDRSFAPKNLGGLVMEAGLAALLLVPHWLG